MTPTQCRMARVGLGKRGWSVNELAKRSGIAARTIARFEAGEAVKLETVEALRSALATAGALFVEVDGRPGVALKRSTG